jgi:Tol biopolymer transport system component/C-terminal processing protease CtpA/Prc
MESIKKSTYIININIMNKALTAAMMWGIPLLAGAATESPLWLRNSAISPDGATIAFTYKGDIYTIPYSGGEARQITSNAAYDTKPIWSPDGKNLAFGSRREGSMDVFVVNANGGTPRRLTTNSGDETPLAFKDNNTIIFSAKVQPSAEDLNGYIFPQLYTVDIEGRRPKLLSSTPSDALSVDGKGRILYQDHKGMEDLLRKHERSSVTCDIWLLTDADTNPQYRKLTDFAGHDINPQWGDGDTYYYVSEESGTLNVYSRNINGGDKKQLTNFDRHPVRSLSVARDGRMVFSRNGELYTMRPGETPRLLTVSIVSDNTVKDIIRTTRTSGATAIAVSPNGKEIAFVLGGDVWVTSVEYGTTKQITNTAAQERHVEFTPDGRALIYDSERDGVWQLYRTKIKNDAEKLFTYSTELVEDHLATSKKICFLPKVSPDGKKVAYLEDRCALRVLNLETGEDKEVLSGDFGYSYSDGDINMEWSPDSEWLLYDGYIGVGGWNNADIAAVKADGSKVVDLTESGYNNSGAKWTADGKGVLFMGDKAGNRSHGSWGSEYDVYVMWLDRDAYDKFLMTKEERDLLKEESDSVDSDKNKSDKNKKDSKKADGKKNKKGEVKGKKEIVNLDFDNRRNRILRLTGNSMLLGDYYLTPEKDKLYYVSVYEDEGDLWELDLNEGVPSIVKKGWGMSTLIPDSVGSTLYSLTSDGIKSIDLKSKEVKSVAYAAKREYNPAKEREYMYEHMKSLVADKFYDADLHGVDWEGYVADYSRFLPYINNDDDFAILLSEVLGELNASHTGGRCRAASDALPTAYLGAFFDESYNGDGLKIKEVIARGPIARRSDKVKSGDIITAIDGVEIKADQDYFPLLAGKVGERIRLQITHADGGKETLVVKGTGFGGNRELLYERWKDRNRAIVDSLSNGKVGYVHITGMDSGSFREIYDDLMGKYRNCDAVVVDTRFNGGGWLHNDVALLLSGKKYVDFKPRGKYIGSEPFSQWCKPSALLVGEANYSDAHGTPYTYKTLGIGKIVGAPVPGTMTAVWWETQINPHIIFGVPQVTCVDLEGKPLENHQLDPDVLIYNLPGEITKGVDRQLEGAVKELLKK